MQMSLIHNERIKLTAAAIDRISTAMFVVGFLGPLASSIFGPPSTAIAFHGIVDIIEGVFWLIIGALLHLTARRLLSGLKS